LQKQPENVPMNNAHNDIPAGVVNQQNLSPGLTVVVKRRIRSGREAEFEQTMRSFVQFALAFPGHRGISVLRPAAGSRDYIAVDKL
jgi:antibiotic biosynthesis monooxygenase (ABM) superfamily enzyme